MKITREMAENCVSLLQERGYSAYVYEHNNNIKVYIVIDDMDLEISADEILNRHNLYLAEIEVEWKFFYSPYALGFAYVFLFVESMDFLNKGTAV